MPPELSDAGLLARLLSTANSPTDDPDDRLLHKLLQAAPRVLRQRRKTTLFETLGVLNLEAPHSDYLAWLLDPQGPLTGNWLLQSLLHRVAPDRPFDAEAIVEREVPIDNGRFDILVTWADFKLVIENKVWSSEGSDQIARYLRSADLSDVDDFRIIYLSPFGELPRSVVRNESRVIPMSYADLVEVIESALHAGLERDTRGEVFAHELCACIKRLLKVRYDMSKPNISESTKIYLVNAKRLNGIKALAIEESSEFIDWLYSEAEKRLRLILGTSTGLHKGQYVTLIHKSQWRHEGYIFGLYVGWNVNPAKKLLTEAREGPWAGIGVWREDDEEDSGGCQPYVDKLLPMVTQLWPHQADLRQADWSMAICREFPFPGDGDIDSWADSVIRFLEDLAKLLSPTLDAFASGLQTAS